MTMSVALVPSHLHPMRLAALHQAGEAGDCRHLALARTCLAVLQCRCFGGDDRSKTLPPGSRPKAETTCQTMNLFHPCAWQPLRCLLMWLEALGLAPRLRPWMAKARGLVETESTAVVVAIAISTCYDSARSLLPVASGKEMARQHPL